MSVVLFAFLKALTTRRDILLWQEETEEQAITRLVKRALPASTPKLTECVSEARWGWMDINRIFLTLCLVTYQPALGPYILRDSTIDLTEFYIITLSGEFCYRNDRTLEITPSVPIMSSLSDICIRIMSPPTVTGDLDADTSIQHEWEEPSPINLQAYAHVGLAILNMSHIVPPDTLSTYYHASAAIGTLVGEVPAIGVDILDPAHVRFAYRSTSLLRLHYGAVRLVASQPLGDDWRGETGKTRVSSTLQEVYARTNQCPENLSTQRLSSLVNLATKDRPISKMFPKQCKDSRFQGVTVLSSDAAPVFDSNFTYTSVWDEPSPAFSATNGHFTSQAYPFLSESSLKVLEFLPLSMKQVVKPPIQAWYLAGVGSDDSNVSVLQHLGHPYAGVLATLPQTLVIAAMMRHYLDDRETYEGPIHDHFESLYDSVIKTSPGIVDSWTYFGTRGSLFPFHQEDALLPSANLMVMGEPKVWIFVTEAGMELLRPLLAEYIAPCYMLHRSIFFHPEFLTRHNIPFTIAVQNAGDLILADARSGHQGWNMGPNLAEAVNYADLAAMQYQKATLYRDGMAVWPCMCGSKPAPTDPTMAKETASNVSGYSISFYRPEWPVSDDLGCSALYQWVDTLLTQIDPTLPSHIAAKHLLELRTFVYEKANKRALSLA